MKVFFFIDEVVYCELGQNQNNINNGGFIKKKDVIPNKTLLKLEVNSLRKKKKTRNQISTIKLKLIEL